jgi:hypothetical protein
MFARALLWRRRVIGKVFEDGEVGTAKICFSFIKRMVSSLN